MKWLGLILTVAALGACSQQTPAPPASAEQQQFEEASRCFLAAGAYAMFEARERGEPNRDMVAHVMGLRADAISKGVALGMTEQAVVQSWDMPGYTRQFLEPGAEPPAMSAFARGEIEHCNLEAAPSTP